MLDRCRQCHISLNLKKCIFCAPFGILLGHVVCKQGLLVDPSKIAVILGLQPPTLVTELRETLVHTRYYKKFIKGYAQITTLLWQTTTPLILFFLSKKEIGTLHRILKTTLFFIWVWSCLIWFKVINLWWFSFLIIWFEHLLWLILLGLSLRYGMKHTCS